MNCPCSSGQSYETCCGPFIKGEALPDTAEKLMRSDEGEIFAGKEIEPVLESLYQLKKKIQMMMKWIEKNIQLFTYKIFNNLFF